MNKAKSKKQAKSNGLKELIILFAVYILGWLLMGWCLVQDRVDDSLTLVWIELILLFFLIAYVMLYVLNWVDRLADAIKETGKR